MALKSIQNYKLKKLAKEFIKKICYNPTQNSNYTLYILLVWLYTHSKLQYHNVVLRYNNDLPTAVHFGFTRYAKPLFTI